MYAPCHERMRRVLIALVVASMVVVAGCSGGPSGTDTPTPTTDAVDDDETDAPDDDDADDDDGDVPDTDTPEDGEGTVAPPSDGPPPGVNDDGTVNTSAIEAAHYSVIQGSSFRIEVTREGGPNPFSFTLYNGSGSARIDLEPLDDDHLSQFYIGGSDVITRLNTSESPPKVYSYGSTSPQTGVVFTYAILSLVYPSNQLNIGTFEADGTVTRDGEELTRLSATGINETAAERNQFSSAEGTITGLSGEVLVSSDGLVREMTLEQTFDSGETRSITFTLTGFGSTTAEEPDWIDEAPKLEGSLSGDGTVLELSHTGGPEIPADTTLTLESGGLGGGLPPSNATLPESVSSGDTVYVYATGSTSDPSVEVSVNEEPSTSDAIDLSQFSPQVSGTLGEVRFAIGVPDDGEEEASDA